MRSSLETKLSSQIKPIPKTIHQIAGGFDLKNYALALDIQNPDPTVDFMFDQVRDSLPKSVKHRMLVIGPGAGRLELPFIERFQNISGKLEVLFVDYSPDSISVLRENLRDGFGFTETSGIWKKQNVSCIISEEDFEFIDLKGIKYDIVLSFFVINFFSNWKYGLKKIISAINPGGVFFFSEDRGDICFIDNIFRVDADDEIKLSLSQKELSERSVFYTLWREYYDKRFQDGYPWNPSISPANMLLVRKIFSIFVSLGVGSFADYPHCWDAQKLSWDDWIDIIRSKNVFNCLNLIPLEDREKYAEDLEKLLHNLIGSDKLKSNPNLKFGHTIYCYKLEGQLNNFEALLDYIIDSEWSKSSINSLSLRKLSPFDSLQLETLPVEHRRRLLFWNNQNPYANNMVTSFISWNLNDFSEPTSGDWSNSVPLLFPCFFSDNDRKRFLISYAIYMALRVAAGKRGIILNQIAQVLLHLFSEKFDLYFRISKDSSEESAKLIYNTDGCFSGICINLSYEIVKNIRREVDILLDEIAFGKVIDHELGIDSIGITKLTNINELKDLILYSYQNEMLDLFSKISNRTVGLRKCIYDSISSVELEKTYLKRFAEAFEGNLSIKAKWSGLNVPLIADSLCFMSYANTIIGSSLNGGWSFSSFIPAKSISKTRNDAYRESDEISILTFVNYYFRGSESLEFEEYNEIISGYFKLGTNIYSLEDTVLQYGKLLLKESRKSAASAIMSRNMSHNIGSHVIPRTKYFDILDRIEDLQILRNTNDKNREYFRDKVIADLKDKLDFYIQQKSDFLAEITTEPLITTKLALFYQDVIHPFIENSLIMDTLASNEDIRYKNSEENEIKIFTYIDDKMVIGKLKCKECGKEYSVPHKIPYSLRCMNCKKLSPLEMCLEDPNIDLRIELPGPLGEFAVYGIIENIIRNSAKHNQESIKSKDLEININVKDNKSDAFYTMEIWDNLTSFSIKDKLEKNIKVDMIEADGKIFRKAWGLAEMKISAALLEGSSDFSNKKNLVITEKKINGNSYLAYKIQIMKPAILYAVLPLFNDSNKIEKLKRMGIWIFNSIEELIQSLNAGREGRTSQFALFDCSNLELPNTEAIIQKLPGILHCLPYRIIIVSGESNLDIKNIYGALYVKKSIDDVGIDQLDYNKIISWLWENWLNRWSKLIPEGMTDVINIYFDQDRKLEPTCSWINIGHMMNEKSKKLKLITWYKNEFDGSAKHEQKLYKEKDYRQIVLDRHSGISTSLLEEINATDKLEHSLFHIDKLSPDFSTISSIKCPPYNSRANELPYKIAEAGYMKILIVDERIAAQSFSERERLAPGEKEEQRREQSSQKLYRKICKGKLDNIYSWHHCLSAKIFVCTHFSVNAEPLKLFSSSNDYGSYLKIEMNEMGMVKSMVLAIDQNCKIDLNYGEFDMMIIHKGILDRWNHAIKSIEQFTETIREKIPFLIIESGRGIPSTISQNDKFLPFSIISQYIKGSVIGKLGLTGVGMTVVHKTRG
jgi:SAM-dependent methyltransferase